MPFFDDVLITAIGDSITAGGTDEEATTGYPEILVTSINAQVPADVTESPERLATGGWTISDVADNLAAWLAGHAGADPDYVLLHIGANDIVDPYWSATDETTWRGVFGGVLDDVHTAWPDSLIYVSKTYRAGATDLARIETLWGWEQAEIAERSAYCFEGIDTVAIFDGHPELMDGGVPGVHPNNAGYVAMAAAWETLLGY